MDKEKLARIMVFVTDRSVIITAVVIIALILLHPTFTKVMERMRMSSTHDIMQGIAQAQNNFVISHNQYTDDFRDLDLNLKDKHGELFEDDSAQIDHFNLILSRNGVLGIRNNKEYFVYYDYKNFSFSCAPREHYICKNIQAVSKNVCEEAEMLWSERNNSCYMNEKDMCLAIGMPWNTKERDIFCGYKNTPNKKIYEGGSCIATTISGCQNSLVLNNAVCEGKSSFGCMQSTLQGGKCISYTETSCHSVQINKDSICLVDDDYSGSYGCQNTTINKGGICLAKGQNTLACNKATINNGGVCRGYANKSCNEATIMSGGICEANAPGVCQEVTVKKGGRCIANMPQTCEGTYEEGACCHGDYCPEDSPKCKCPGYATVC